TERKQADEALQRKAFQMDSFINNIPDIAWLKDTNSNFIMVNKAYGKVVGIAQEKFVNNTSAVYFDEETVKKFEEDDQRVVKSGEKIVTENSIINAEGNRIFLETIKSPIFNESGKVIGTVGVARDITEWKRTEKKIKENQRKMEIISKTAMQFVEFPLDEDVYKFIGEQLKNLVGKDSFIIINSIDKGTNDLITRAVLGMGKFTKKVFDLLGKSPIGMKNSANDRNLNYLSDGLLHDSGKSLYEISLKTIPKPVCLSLEKMFNVGKIFTIGFTQKEQLLGTAIIVLRESATEIKDYEVVETYIRQASIAIQRRQAEEALHKSEKKYRLLAETSTDTIISIDLEGKFTYLSQAIEKLTGYNWEHFLGHSFTEFIAPEYVESTIARFEKALKGEKIPLYEIEILHKNGSKIPVELNVSTLFDIKGKTIGRLAIVRDITERKKAELSLKESERNFRLLFETSPLGNFIAKPDGTILDANQTLLTQLGSPSVEATCKINVLKFPPLVKCGFAEKFIECAKSGKNIIEEFPYQSKWGKEVIMSCYIVPLKNDFGKVEKIYILLENIMKRKKAEEQVKKDLEEKKTLLRELYHRTKNNMQVIASMMQLQSLNTDDEFIHRSFNEIIDKIKAMSLVHNKLYESKDLSKINLKDYIADLIELLMINHSVPKDQISLKLDLQDVLLLLDSAIPLGLVLNELISNVFKHAFPDNRKGEICIRLFREENGTINIHFGDNGVGLPAEFDPRKNDSMGLQTMLDLVEYQLQGEINHTTKNGLQWDIKLNDNLYERRVQE
ncbi:MAG: PAS domain S-box protein, partial [Candidatus Cloacimonadota bacterium]|nr:PAS domain S-box protein [Candidatus Cloacimonadota bacterium]